MAKVKAEKPKKRPKKKKTRKKRVVKLKSIRRTWYLFGLRPDWVVEFVRTARVYSASQACAFLRKRHPEQLRSLDDGERYLHIWAHVEKSAHYPLCTKTGQCLLPF